MRRTIRNAAQIKPALQQAEFDLRKGMAGGKSVILEWKPSTRTLEQNAKIHAMFEEFSQQAEHAGQKFSAADWKILLVHGFGKEVRLLPALDGGVIGVPSKTSEFTKAEGAEFIEYLNAKGAFYGVKFRAPERWE